MTAELDPWARQRAMLGHSGQQRLAAARVLVVGCGGLGAGSIPALVASGVGTVTLLDDDVIEPSNLNRQTLFTTDDLGQPKVERAAQRMRALSPTTSITALRRRLAADDVALVAEHDLVLDCTDKNASRAAISTACAAAGVPWVWAAVERWSGVLSVFAPDGPRWEDVVGSTDDSPAPPDVLGATPAVLGAMQAAEAIALITGVGEPLIGQLMLVDLRRHEVRTIALEQGPARSDQST